MAVTNLPAVVQTRTLVDPPVVPIRNVYYIVPSGGSGAWASHTNNITWWDGSHWKFITPPVGATVWVDAEDIQLVWDRTSWALTGLATSSEGSPGGVAELDAYGKVLAEELPSIVNTVAGRSGSVTLSVSDISGAASSAALASEASLRIDADTTLTNALAAEQTARTSADITITGTLAAEATTRASADTTLTNALAAEVTARVAAEATLTANIAAEVTNRGTAVSGEASARTSADATLTTNLAAEVTNRVAADATLSADISSEATTRSAADSLKANIASPTFTGTVGGISKSMVGLGNADNTSDTAKPISTAQQSALDLKAPLASPTFTGTVSAATVSVSGNLLPTVTSTQDIGSSLNRFRAIYVDTAYLSTNTLYLGDVPVLGTSQNTVNISADPNQGITIKTTGTGQSKIISENGTELSVSGLNADVKIQATGAGSRAVLGATSSIEMTAPSTNISGGLTVSGTSTFSGNVTFNGTNTIVNTTSLVAKDNIILLNSGEIGNGITAGSAGIRVDRGDLADHQLIFDETNDKWKAGAIGAEATICLLDSSNLVPIAQLSGIPNASLVNSGLTIGSTSISLGASSTTLAGLSSVSSTSFVGSLTGNSSTATTAGTVTTAAQSAITSVGTLTSLSVGSMAVMSASLTTSSSTAGQVVMSIPQATYRSAEFMIQGSASGVFHTTRIIAVQSGSSVEFTEYGAVQIGGLLGSFSLVADGTYMKLIVTPASSNSTVFKINALLTIV